MLRMVGMMVRMKKIMTVVVDVRECPVLSFSVPVIMLMGMEVLIMPFIGIFGVVMVVPVRNLVAVPVVMIVMRVMLLIMRVIMVMGMLMPFMCMGRSGLRHLPFLFLCNK
jgi:hypothetical protein